MISPIVHIKINTSWIKLIRFLEFRSASRERAKNIELENENLETELNSILGNQGTQGNHGNPGNQGHLADREHEKKNGQGKIIFSI